MTTRRIERRRSGLGLAWIVHLALLGAAAGGCTWAFADDDDDDEHELHGSKERRTAAKPGAGGTTDVAVNKAWQEECGSCHLAFQPSFLPERSWRKMMGGLKDHFGENAELDVKVRDEITTFLVDNSADRSSTRRGKRVTGATPAAETPLRITETKYFKRLHHEVAGKVWKRPKIGTPANCAACHPGATQNDYEEDRVRIPRG